MADPRKRRGPGGRPPRRARVDPAREIALEILTRVRTEDAYVNLLLPALLRRAGLTGRDAAFTTALVSGAVRGQLTYDAVIDACVDRSPHPKVRDALRLGAHQLLGMRVASHAAVSTTVDLVRSQAGPGAAGFANAVMRRIGEADLATWVRRLAPADPTGFRSIAFSHPRWVVESLAEAVGDGDEVDALLEADNAPPKVTLVARPGRATVAELGGMPSGLSPYGVVLDSGDPGSVPAVAEGRAGVQDEGSQLVALALAEAPLQGADERWLDLCAGPGGKSALLAALAAERGAVLVANEAQPHRAGLVRRNLTDARNGWLVAGTCGVIAGDGTHPAFRDGTFDRVLVDAPCSGLGALRRRPEARWRRRPEDIDGLVPLQRCLLTSALRLVRPGGVVLYATCSPVLAETRGVVESVLAAQPAGSDVRLQPVTGSAGDVPDAAGPMAGTVQLWPHRHGTDAMFMALLRRT
ncbi:transcription antitermination factor NusB [Nocardioides sp. AN3]